MKVVHKLFSWIITGDFFRLWSGMLFSQMSSFLFYFTLIWWSIEKLGTPLHGSIIIGLGIAVSVIVSPFSGWCSDRFHRGKLMAVSDMLSAFGFLTIFFSLFLGSDALFVMYGARILISLAQSPIDPAFRSLMQDTVKEEQLEKAIAFQGTILEMAQLITPVLAGVLVAFSSFEVIFLICFLLCLTSSLWELRIHDKRGNQPDIKMTRRSFTSGFEQLWKNRSLRLLAISTSIQQLMFSAFPIYIAVWVKVILEKNAAVGGSLQTVWSVGIILASFLLTFLANKKHTKTIVPIALMCCGILIFPIGLVTTFVLAFALLLFAGLSSGVANIHLEGFLQRACEGKERARILSAFMAINSALVPLGYAGGGILSDLLTPFWLFITIAIPVPLTAWLVLKSILLWERANKSEQQEQVGS